MMGNRYFTVQLQKGSLEVLFLSNLLETEALYILMLSFVSKDYVKMKDMIRLRPTYLQDFFNKCDRRCDKLLNISYSQQGCLE